MNKEGKNLESSETRLGIQFDLRSLCIENFGQIKIKSNELKMSQTKI